MFGHVLTNNAISITLSTVILKESGLKMNKSTTESLWLRSLKSRSGKDEPFVISCPQQYALSLGVAFAYKEHIDTMNFDDRLAKLEKVLNVWSG